MYKIRKSCSGNEDLIGVLECPIQNSHWMHLNRRYERCQHPYIHPLDMKREKKYGADWRINLSRSNPPQKNQARYYDLFKCFQLKHLLKYCSMGYLTSKAVRDHWANKSWMTPYCCQYFMYHFVPKNLLVPETRLRRLLQLKLMWSFAKQPPGIKWTTMKWNVHGVAYPATH